MAIDRIIEMAGIMLIAAAFLRVMAGATLLAVQNIRAKRQFQRDEAAFRARAGKAFEETRPGKQPRADPVRETRTLRIVERVAENLKGDICSFILAPADDRPLWRYRPGQFLTLSLSVPGERGAVKRCYSLSETPLAPQTYYRITVKRLCSPDGVPGTASGLLHDAFQKGDTVEVLPPAGSFCLDQMSERKVVLIGAGVGITPLLSMLNWLVATNSQREISVFYGARDRTEIPFANHLKAMEGATPNLRTVIFFSRPGANCRRGIDYDVEGHVSVEVMKLLLKERAHEFYLCGPTRMMEIVTADLKAWGVPAADIRCESFGAAQDSAASSLRVASAASDKAFRIAFARSNRCVAWNGSFGSLLELSEVLDLPARHACRAGQCGTCKVAVKSGAVAYLRKPEAEIEAGHCLPCIARPASDLVLDL